MNPDSPHNQPLKIETVPGSREWLVPTGPQSFLLEIREPAKVNGRVVSGNRRVWINGLTFLEISSEITPHELECLSQFVRSLEKREIKC